MQDNMCYSSVVCLFVCHTFTLIGLYCFRISKLVMKLFSPSSTSVVLFFHAEYHDAIPTKSSFEDR